MAGARRRSSRCARRTGRSTPTSWRAAITPKTRLVLLNSPHNPTGKVFSDDELDLVAATCVERDLLVVTDEVYEHLVFDGRPPCRWPAAGHAPTAR